MVEKFPINSTVRFTKIRKVKSPKRNYGDAGNDFFIPDNTPEFVADLLEVNKDNDVSIHDDSIIIGPHSQILVPCGIKVDIIDKRTYLDANNKSGVATKKSLIVGAKVIDSIYQGEVHMNVHNVSDKEQVIHFGEKLVQFIHKEYIMTEWYEISNEEYNKIEPSERAERGFGNGTGLK